MDLYKCILDVLIKLNESLKKNQSIYKIAKDHFFRV